MTMMTMELLLFLLISQEQQGGRCSMMPQEVKEQMEFNRDAFSAGWVGMGYETGAMTMIMTIIMMEWCWCCVGTWKM